MRLLHKPLLPTAVIALAAVMYVSAQDSRPRFEVASIKMNTSSNRLVAPLSISGGRFVANNYTLQSVINWAYRATDGSAFLLNQIVGLPSWASTDHWDIQATPEGEARPVPVEEMQAMVQALLQDRFQLKSHRETHEGPIYILTVVKPGKIKQSADQSIPPPSTGPPGANPTNSSRGRAFIMIGRTPSGNNQGTLFGSAVPITNLVDLLHGAGGVGGTVVDKTDLKGLFDFNFKFTPQRGLSAAPIDAGGGQPGTADPIAPSLFTALQEELGLKLESARGPVEVLVIDSVSKPSEN